MIIEAKQINDDRINKCLLDKLNKNSYSLHSENMICAMLTDLRPNIRMKAVEKIIKCRETPEIIIRKFEKPRVNYDADDYHELIDNSNSWLEPILTMDITDRVLNEYTVPTIIFDKYPSHTQSVERNIRLVSQTSKTIISHEERDARINVTLIHRKLFPKLSTKRDFFYFV